MPSLPAIRASAQEVAYAIPGALSSSMSQLVSKSMAVAMAAILASQKYAQAIRNAFTFTVFGIQVSDDVNLPTMQVGNTSIPVTPLTTAQRIIKTALVVILSAVSCGLVFLNRNFALNARLVVYGKQPAVISEVAEEQAKIRAESLRRFQAALAQVKTAKRLAAQRESSSLSNLCSQRTLTTLAALAAVLGLQLLRISSLQREMMVNANNPAEFVWYNATCPLTQGPLEFRSL